MKQYTAMKAKRFGVYSIIGGCAAEMVFEGTHAKCKKYVSKHDELRGKCIITPL